MKINTGRCIQILFLVAVVFTFCNAFLLYYNLARLSNDTTVLSRTYQVVSNLKSVYATIREAESSQRAYLLTNNKTHLDTYTTAQSQIASDISTLTNLVKNDPFQIRQIKKLNFLIQKRMKDLRQGINVFTEEGFEPAQQYMLKDDGSATMFQIVSLVSALEKHENDYGGFNEQRTFDRMIVAYVAITLAALLSVTMLVISFILTKREFDRQYQADLRKNEFISMASHELQTPITSMNAFAHVLEKKIAKQKDTIANNYIQKMKDLISKQTNLINDLLDISKMQAGKIEFHREIINVTTMVKHTVEVVQATASHHKIVVKGKITRNVYVDRERVSQVLSNFLSNAIKYSPDAKRVVVSLSENEREIFVNVTDFGIGISRREQRRIFSRFYRTKASERNFPGLGIGLYISYEIIKRQGGRITVESEEGKGSTFCFNLPVSEKV